MNEAGKELDSSDRVVEAKVVDGRGARVDGGYS